MRTTVTVAAVLLTIGVAAVVFVGLLLALNGYSERRALPILGGYALAAIVVTVLAAPVARATQRRLSGGDDSPGLLSTLGALGASVGTSRSGAHRRGRRARRRAPRPLIRGARGEPGSGTWCPEPAGRATRSRAPPTEFRDRARTNVLAHIAATEGVTNDAG